MWFRADETEVRVTKSAPKTGTELDEDGSQIEQARAMASDDRKTSSTWLLLGLLVSGVAVGAAFVLTREKRYPTLTAGDEVSQRLGSCS